MVDLARIVHLVEDRARAVGIEKRIALRVSDLRRRRQCARHKGGSEYQGYHQGILPF